MTRHFQTISQSIWGAQHFLKWLDHNVCKCSRRDLECLELHMQTVPNDTISCWKFVSWNKKSNKLNCSWPKIILLLLEYCFLPSFGIHIESFNRVNCHTLAITSNYQNHILDYSHCKITSGVFHAWDRTPMIHFSIQSFNTPQSISPTVSTYKSW